VTEDDDVLAAKGLMMLTGLIPNLKMQAKVKTPQFININFLVFNYIYKY
jgi:hypothetical protein